jgi:hypothetical protein
MLLGWAPGTDWALTTRRAAYIAPSPEMGWRDFFVCLSPTDLGRWTQLTSVVELSWPRLLNSTDLVFVHVWTGGDCSRLQWTRERPWVGVSVRELACYCPTFVSRRDRSWNGVLFFHIRESAWSFVSRRDRSWTVVLVFPQTWVGVTVRDWTVPAAVTIVSGCQDDGRVTASV